MYMCPVTCGKFSISIQVRKIQKTSLIKNINSDTAGTTVVNAPNFFLENVVALFIKGCFADTEAVIP